MNEFVMQIASSILLIDTDNDIGIKGVKILGEALIHNSSLTQLNLRSMK